MLQISASLSMRVKFVEIMNYKFNQIKSKPSAKEIMADKMRQIDRELSDIANSIGANYSGGKKRKRKKL